MKKIAVITANFGGIDKPKEIPEQDIEFDRYYFTEENSPYDFNGLDNRLKAKYFKWQMHRLELEKAYDAFIWVDGNIQIKKNNVIGTLVNGLDFGDISISSHPSRNCIYEEAKFIMEGVNSGNAYLKTRYNQSIQNEVDYYRSMGHPENSGLKWCGLFAVKNDLKNLVLCNNIWNDQILRSNFDQNSFMFYALKHETKMIEMNWGNFHKNENYKLIHHTKLM